jgi:hypothetical protein
VVRRGQGEREKREEKRGEPPFLLLLFLFSLCEYKSTTNSYLGIMKYRHIHCPVYSLLFVKGFHLTLLYIVCAPSVTEFKISSLLYLFLSS